MQRAWRHLPATVPLIAVLAMVVLFHLAPPIYRGLLELWMVQFHSPPFLDAGGVASALECERLGIDTYIENPCDPLERQLVYPPIWKLGAMLPVTYAGWTTGVAIVFIVAFLASLWLLAQPRSLAHALILTLAAISPPVGWAVNSGNNELLLFAIVAIGTWVWCHGDRARLFAYGTFALAGVLKYFPAAVLLLALKEEPSKLLWIAFAAVGIAVGTTLVWLDEWPAALANVWNISAFTYTYGTENAAALFSTLGLFDRAQADVFKWLFSALVILAGWRYSKRKEGAEALQFLETRELAFLLSGALLITASYLVTQNVAYRLIYLLMVLPALLVVASRSTSSLLCSLPYLAILAMFIFPIRRHLAELGEPGSTWWTLVTTLGIYVREAAWLFLASGLLALILCWARGTTTFQVMVRTLPPALAKQL